ncbi:hydroxymethylglutaryl-CoA lyase [Ramlibacter sp. G-1-2-2]|uniref:Hydroxymethylglutaryl-CoA lyase n=1 Tax=Ramlibacter agri TaxID=2728837 RepID=A0A848HAW2_9BURK|nr:hydroxymethylglutaryl-CoA lyase [Ramlibacter agri]NML47597.1 hydroxymethylglutaryl-CoA lyase [Ramlibacter agri]
MSDIPKKVHIREEGPREGFQIEPGPISTADKIALIDALSDTGVDHIQTVSFVNPKAVPGWADADAVVRGMKKKDGVEYTALWFNEQGLQRALAHQDKLHVTGALIGSASDVFCRKNLNRSIAEHTEVMRKQAASLVANAVPIRRVGVMAAFGCNYSGEVSVQQALEAAETGMSIAREAGARIEEITLADSMGWCTPARTERLVGAFRERWPEVELILHLHDTRGMGVASAHAALRMGVTSFDSTVAGLGGCPFAGRPGATGNIASEELVLLCHEMGIETGVDLEALIEVGRMAERLVGHPLPSTLLRSGSYQT